MKQYIVDAFTDRIFQGNDEENIDSTHLSSWVGTHITRLLQNFCRINGCTMTLRPTFLRIGIFLLLVKFVL